MSKRWTLLVIAAALASACGSADGETGAPSPTPSLPGYAASANPTPGDGGDQGGSGALEGLTIELILGKESVAAGDNLRSELVFQNRSGEVVIDPQCYIASANFGLVPADDPGAELWGSIITDCGGPFRMEPGFKDRFSGPTFQATTPQGEPLAPGDYLAALKLRGRAERFLVPVEVTG